MKLLRLNFGYNMFVDWEAQYATLKIDILGFAVIFYVLNYLMSVNEHQPKWTWQVGAGREVWDD